MLLKHCVLSFHLLIHHGCQVSITHHLSTCPCLASLKLQMALLTAFTQQIVSSKLGLLAAKASASGRCDSKLQANGDSRATASKDWCIPKM